MENHNQKYVTLDNFIDQRRTQDKLIGQEFYRQRIFIEKAISELTAKLAQFQNGMIYLKEELKQTKLDLKDELNQKLGQVKQELHRFDQIEARTYNAQRSAPWHMLFAVGVYQPETGFQMPKYFPATAGDLWKLKSPLNAHHLEYLAEFYDLQGFQNWGFREAADLQWHGKHINSSTEDLTSDESESSSNSRDSVQVYDSLHEAVIKHPLIAIEEVSLCIGLNFDKLRNFYKRAVEYRHTFRISKSKRHQSATEQANPNPKRRLIPEGISHLSGGDQLEEVPSVSQILSEPKRRIEVVSPVMKKSFSNRSKESKESSKVIWEHSVEKQKEQKFPAEEISHSFSEPSAEDIVPESTGIHANLADRAKKPLKLRPATKETSSEKQRDSESSEIPTVPNTPSV